MEENEMKDNGNVRQHASGLYSKISKLRADAMLCDWKGDKMISVGGNSYMYVSSPKMRRNFAPLLNKHGLEMKLRYHDLQQLPALQKKDFHWCIALDVTLVDCDSGESETYTVFGESSDNTDKGIAMAQTIALRQWVLQEFIITDGFDPEDMDSTKSGEFTPKKPSEAEEVRSKILDNGLPPEKKEEKSPEVITESKVPEVKTEGVPRRRVDPATLKKKAAETADVPNNGQSTLYGVTEQSGVESPNTKKDDVEGSGSIDKINDLDFLTDAISIIQRSTIEKIVKSWMEAAEKGKVDAKAYNEMSLNCASIKTAGDASAFIKEYRKVPE